MRINVEYLMNKINEWADSEGDYEKVLKSKPSWTAPAEKYNKWINDLDYRYKDNKEAYAALDAMFTLLGITDERQKRAYASARALRKWYKRTRWTKNPDRRMFVKIGDWIFSTESRDHYDRYEEKTAYDSIHVQYSDWWHTY